MKKQFSILAVAMALLMSVTSCSNENSDPTPTGEGSLKINFDFATANAPQTKTATTDAVPTTAWSNIGAGNLQLVLVQSGIVKVVRDVTVPSAGAANTSVQTFDRIPTGDYDIYMIANNNKVGNPVGGTSAKIGTAGVIQAGTNFNTALFILATANPASILGTAPIGGAYDEASELFIGYNKGTVKADISTATIDVKLKRAVSLLRIRIDQTDVTSEANTIDFQNKGNTNTSIRLRRHAGTLKMQTPAPATFDTTTEFATPQFGATKINFAFVSTKVFKATAPGTDYNGSMGLGTDFTLWNDYIILPGGSTTTGADKFNLLLSGHAPNNYVGKNGVISNGSGATARVWWQGDVDGLIAANGVLSLNVKIATKGYVDPNPPADETYGKIDITATLVNWSPVTNVTVPL